MQYLTFLNSIQGESMLYVEICPRAGTILLPQGGGEGLPEEKMVRG